jgi:phosphate transport system substrate-binding protein
MGSWRTGLFRRKISAKLLAAGLGLVSLGVAYAAAQTLSETGSTLAYPLFKAWIAEYAKVDPAVQISASATGSGAGIEQAADGRVRIGMSDAYMSDTQAMASPHILNIPLAISAQIVAANLPELHGARLKLSGPVLAGIYSGSIRDWDAAPIATLNRGLRLPHHAIVPVRRSDSSGDTFIFTQFLTFSSDDWENHLGYGTTVEWPVVSGELTAAGNQAMAQTIAHTPYAVGYFGASFEAQASAGGLEPAMLQNQEGKFLLPNEETISAAAASLTPRTPADGRLTLVFAPGSDSYPLINYEYAVVSDTQPSKQIAGALSNFLLWCASPQGGNAASFLGPGHFIALPTAIRARSEIQIAKIH